MAPEQDEIASELIARSPLSLLVIEAADRLDDIRRAWQELETRVGLRGRRFYGVVNIPTGIYWAGTTMHADDPPDRFGLETHELAGGTYARSVLQGGPPGIYDAIGRTVQRLLATVDVDRSRNVVEFYKRHDTIELWCPCHDPQRMRTQT
ncbi:MAG: GyrI-like domain-containing protein [Candidatus Dormiibacterota bacterium]